MTGPQCYDQANSSCLVKSENYEWNICDGGQVLYCARQNCFHTSPLETDLLVIHCMEAYAKIRMF